MPEVPGNDRAIEALRAAVLASKATDEWWIGDREAFDLVQYSVVRWVDDLGRSLQRVQRALVEVERHTGELTGEMVDTLEGCLTQVVGARDKVVAITAQLLGVPSLRLHRKGVRFEPGESAIKSKLSEVGASGQREAGRLKSQLDALSDHPAIVLRNQITHALSPLGAVVENCWIRRASLDEKGGIVAWSRGPLYPEGTLDQGDIPPQTIWAWALESANEAQELLVNATTALAGLASSMGSVAPPQAVFIWPDGKVQFDRPESDWLDRGLSS
jgi:hypothetical protein